MCVEKIAFGTSHFGDMLARVGGGAEGGAFMARHVDGSAGTFESGSVSD